MDQTSFRTAEVLSYIPSSLQRSTVTSGHNHEGLVKPLAPSKLPFISNRMHLFTSHQGSVCNDAAKTFDAKEKLLLSGTHVCLRNGADGICSGFYHLAWLKYLNLDPL